ncbi:amidohydrolase family protein [Microvirga lotononidis]|uniref:Cytosine deaminase-like metal-dependent hydrolase n=1 Tax=Microvirga lotononidis TaxID=864069 RepID=I4YY50_9HYPH|nr:amidohydrolase [Microvirga lotononidis]EIM28892.1 cytosine deaminase-like metal-dependent hydrolase [Microvirga lotononidis]WQO26812.1 amidohydrolase [Microvirga lotononidis]
MAAILIQNACLLPIDEAMSIIDRGWMHVENGTIQAIGSGEPPRIEGAELIDVDGNVIMPGMVNPHAHLAMTLFRGLGEDVDDRLFRYVLPMERKFVSPEMVRVGTLLGALESIEAGVTTIADMYYYETEVGRALDQAGLRGVVGQTLATFDPPDHKTIDQGFALVEDLVSEFSGHERIVPSIAPHAPYSTDIDVMARVARWAEDHPDVPVQLHLAEMDSEMEWCRKNHGLRPVAVVEKAGLLRPGLIAAHCLHIDPFEIERMAKADVRVAHNARSNAKAGRGIAPIEAMRAAGIKVGIATDGPMSGNTLDLFSQFGPVSMFQKLLGHSRKPMPAAQVIRMATLEGAQVLGLDSRIGSLEPGKQADLIRIDLSAPRMQPIYDIYATLVFSAMPVDVQDVMVGGRWIMRGRKVESLERKEILRDAGQIATAFKAEMARIDAAG